VLAAFGLVDPSPAVAAEVRELADDDDVRIALGERNQRLAPFWLTNQADTPPVPSLKGRTAVVLDAEDDFVNMLRHVLGVLGMTSVVVRHDAYEPGCLDGYDLAVVGPGPGDPREVSDPKMATLRAATATLLERQQPFLAVCLGHQILSGLLGLDLVYKDIVFQGTQTRLPVLGHERVVGFYNTFVARVPRGGLPPGVRVETDPVTGDIHLLAGPHYRSVQFHAESILSQSGADVLRELVSDLLA
jgi:phenazine biosynthesis protein phzE